MSRVYTLFFLWVFGMVFTTHADIKVEKDGQDLKFKGLEPLPFAHGTQFIIKRQTKPKPESSDQVPSLYYQIPGKKKYAMYFTGWSKTGKTVFFFEQLENGNLWKKGSERGMSLSTFVGGLQNGYFKVDTRDRLSEKLKNSRPSDVILKKLKPSQSPNDIGIQIEFEITGLKPITNSKIKDHVLRLQPGELHAGNYKSIAPDLFTIVDREKAKVGAYYFRRTWNDEERDLQLTLNAVFCEVKDGETVWKNELQVITMFGAKFVTQLVDGDFYIDVSGKKLEELKPKDLIPNLKKLVKVEATGNSGAAAYGEDGDDFEYYDDDGGLYEFEDSVNRDAYELRHLWNEYKQIRSLRRQHANKKTSHYEYNYL